MRVQHGREGAHKKKTHGEKSKTSHNGFIYFLTPRNVYDIVCAGKPQRRRCRKVMGRHIIHAFIPTNYFLVVEKCVGCIVCIHTL